MEAKVEGGTLVLSTGTRGAEQRGGLGAPTVRITTPALRSILVTGGADVSIAQMKAPRIDIGLNGAGRIAVAAMRAEELQVTLAGTGQIVIAGSSGKLRARLLGAGSLDGRDFTADDATLISESSGDMVLTARYTAQVIAMATGSVHVMGKPYCTVNGPGPVDCGENVTRKGP